MRRPLDKELRRDLESAVVKARDIAESAAAEELHRLSVPTKAPADYLADQQRALRNRLRAHGRVLGDIRRADGEQEIALLVTEVAYQHWHRMLFARFLAENDLLIYEDGVTPLSIHDCFELAEEETGDRTKGWQYAASYAAAMLPQIFRLDSPVFELSMAPNDQKQLEKLLDSLDSSTFTASDSLGWVYQFWQSKRKDEVNDSEVKIGAKELSPVTQLFTEPYMVSFLLDNALGAWWANQQLTEADYNNAQSEDELRTKAAIDGVPLEYLRFVRTYTPGQQAILDSEEASEDKPEPQGPWEPAGGKFEQWPNELGELKTLDPCCGSGHFLVAVFLMLVPMRMQREGLTEQQAIDSVISQNIFGLELDQRCVEIAAFALALEAWRYPNGGGYRLLPELHLACSGLSVKAAKEEWKQLGLGKKNLTIALDWMHKHFNDAPVLGSLINPAKSDASKIVSWEKLSETLNTALKNESATEHDSEVSQHSLEATVVAQGMAKAATMLADRYQWVVTNVPYLARGKQVDALKKFIERNYPEGKNDLATAFLDRCLNFCLEGGSVSAVLPQNWLFLSSYENYRKRVLANEALNLLARLGAGAFDTISGEVVKAILLNVTHDVAIASLSDSLPDASAKHLFRGVDVSQIDTVGDKAKELSCSEIESVWQYELSQAPGLVISTSEVSNLPLLQAFADALQGISPADAPRYSRQFWELSRVSGEWEYWQSTPDSQCDFDGKDLILWFNNDLKEAVQRGQAYMRGAEAKGRSGIVVKQMGRLPSSIHTGAYFDTNCSVVLVKDDAHLPAIWSFCASPSYNEAVRELDQSLKVTNANLVKIPFDYKKWSMIADKQYPTGLPKPYTNQPTQWLFHGHPCGSVVWDEESKTTAREEQRIDQTVLQVAVARLVGYQWPAEFDLQLKLAEEQRELLNETNSLPSYCDDDGIVCIPGVRGERPVDQRLEELLQAAYGSAWTTQTRNELLETVGCKNKSMEFWLREKFFEQHSKLFQNRPYIWQIWDGLKDGFSVLVNYHLLDRKNLERLIFTYLDDWIRTQKHEQSEGVDGAGVRLSAAEGLKRRLEQILEGEAPYDVFVRWKPLEEHSIGWNPDLNDGVRVNIRPFMSVEDVGKKGAGILRAKPNIHWKKDRGKDVESAPWYKLGLAYGGKEGDRINDHHLTLAEKRAAAAD
jgi:Eco57I restriction-modification methylase